MAETRLKTAGIFGLGLLIMAAVAAVIAIVLGGFIWLLEKVAPYLVPASVWTLAVCTFILLPLCIFRKTRPWAGAGFFFASFIFGMTLWVFSMEVCLDLWGVWAIVVGLLMLGAGVLPIAALAALFTGHWGILLGLIGWTAVTFTCRIGGNYLASRAPNREEEAMSYVAGDGY